MDSYIDIHLKPDAEMSEAELSSKVFTKFHKALATLNSNNIGISFPQAKLKLGRIFRVHGNASILHDLQGLDWLGPLTGYCKVSVITDVPKQTQYRVISVKRSNLSQAKLKRLIARGSIDAEGQKRYKVKMLSQGFDNPYLDLMSASTGQVYRKFFEFSDIYTKPVMGEFDAYGLSHTATIPWF
ncbi:type I-F CRISPR-associated endoribonuclease Cas6/Csy4 [Alishewanella sp. 16-MA]|uniref:Type I-F CRISPR-associated endoribonuclease Cas6/Csy4 n=1 Tax=Alishewanella maricola TaxID=2795740 RepID=A0ABS8C2T4_9ALTE|nr:type I-F CRISPR-associated endoribonuclease Cas6/Csy4 [Alishewanella maricola]MCB5226626.1 type I-F CRISPR-associated endoribonuclease Cas6/Csy4 [Alishewanella maricola]